MKNLLSPDKAPTTQQRNESNKAQFGEPVGLLQLLTPEDERRVTYGIMDSSESAVPPEVHSSQHGS